MKKLIFLCAAVLGILLPLLPGSEENKPGLSLKETFELYVRSIRNCDLKGLFTTVTNSEKFFFLTSTGRLIDTRTGYYQFHEDWFKEKNWEMPVDTLEVHEGDGWGYTTAIFHYRSKKPDGGLGALDSWFTLIFHKEEGIWKVVADICTPISRFSTEANPEVKYTADQQFLFDTIKNRRTVRKFKADPVPREHLLKILDAAHYAATSGNQQPWKFLVVQDRQKLDALKKAALAWTLKKYEEGGRMPQDERNAVRQKLQGVLDSVLSAPVYVAVLVDSQSAYPGYNFFDGTLAMGNLMIAARALGYGTGFFTSYFPGPEMKKFFNIPDQYTLICFTPIGVPDAWPPTPSKKDLKDLVIFETFGTKNK
jgi:nitroreductase/ketosteroid isomerase-like protein